MDLLFFLKNGLFFKITFVELPVKLDNYSTRKDVVQSSSKELFQANSFFAVRISEMK